MRQFRFSPALPERPAITPGDAVIVLGIATILYAGARLALHVPQVIAGPDISLSPAALPWYVLLSVGRMAIAYVLSLLFSLFYGYAAARNRTARTVLMPLLDVLQSVPILSFLPKVRRIYASKLKGFLVLMARRQQSKRRAPRLTATEGDLLYYRAHIREACQNDHVMCLECGLTFKALPQHLGKHYLTDDRYKVR